MPPSEAELLNAKVSHIVGIPLDAWQFAEEGRTGIKFSFPGWPEQTSPIFSIRQSGIFGAVVCMRFGRMAGQCIRQLNAQDNPEKRALSSALLQQLNINYRDEDGIAESIYTDLQFTGDTNIQFRYRNIDSKDPAEDGMLLILTPLVACIANLFEQSEDVGEGGCEGGDKTVTLTRKERSPRNRMLAFMVHGKTCGVCGLKPVEEFGDELCNILEIHHIEPLCELKEARIYDPRTDLIPLCPNCHKMIHTRKPAYRPEELKELLA